MTPREAAQVQQDPNAIPDSDDEEEDRERSKVRNFVTDNHERFVSNQCHRHLHLTITPASCGSCTASLGYAICWAGMTLHSQSSVTLLCALYSIFLHALVCLVACG